LVIETVLIFTINLLLKLSRSLYYQALTIEFSILFIDALRFLQYSYCYNTCQGKREPVRLRVLNNFSNVRTSVTLGAPLDSRICSSCTNPGSAD